MHNCVPLNIAVCGFCCKGTLQEILPSVIAFTVCFCSSVTIRSACPVLFLCHFSVKLFTLKSI